MDRNIPKKELSKRSRGQWLKVAVGLGLILISEILRAHGFDFWLGMNDAEETCFSIWM